MNINEKIRTKMHHIGSEGPIVIGFLGDSVTQGCFDFYITETGEVETVFDSANAYCQKLREMLSLVYPKVQFSVINAGISGDSAVGGLERIDRDLISYKPDLAVLSFGLNDCGNGKEGLRKYLDALGGMFTKLNEAKIETIFMTPNMMCRRYNNSYNQAVLSAVAERTAGIQNSGILDLYLEAAKKKAEENNIRVCDCYSIWKKLDENGADITLLLANKINHPTREMQNLFAQELFRTILFS